MKFSLAVFLFAALLASGALASTSSSPGTEQVLYGHVTSVTRDGSSYRLHGDPASRPTGVAAERPCGCKPVPNDHVVIAATHRPLPFAVRKDARVTVLVRGRSSGKVTISVAVLAKVVQGKIPRYRRLLEPRAAFWIRVLQTYPSPVVALDQQYQP